MSSQLISYTITTPTDATKNPNRPTAGPNFKAPPVAVGVLTLLLALDPLSGLVALGTGAVMGGVPKLLRLVEAE